MRIFSKTDRTEPEILMLAPGQIILNPDQPRRFFDQNALDELASSIKSLGIIQPLIVRKKSGVFELVAGERRYRAAQIAGIKLLPCALVSADDEQAAFIALCENVQRRDLGFFEEARAVARLIGQFGLTQEAVARRLGKSQPAIANKLRLLSLDGSCMTLIIQNGLTERHARALLRLHDPAARVRALEHMIKYRLNVETAEKYVSALVRGKPKKNDSHILVRDLRLFSNTVEKALSAVRDSGIEAECVKEETENSMRLIITLKRLGKTPVSVLGKK